MNVTDIQCQESGWRRCDRLAVIECIICGSPLCEPCFRRHRVMSSHGWAPACSKPSCKRLLSIKEHYGELVAEGRL